MPAELEVRDATRNDLRTLVDLYTAAGLDTRGACNEADMRGLWDRMKASAPGVRVFIFTLAGLPVGTYTLFILPLLAHNGAPEAIVEDVAVHPEAQGQGIGRHMMEHARTLAREAGCYKLALSSNQKRVEAHAFYERLGFERHGYSFVVTP
ncbi:MAG: GNAT family N-acetyltransferase [Rhizobacter sp.]